MSYFQPTPPGAVTMKDWLNAEVARTGLKSHTIWTRWRRGRDYPNVTPIYGKYARRRRRAFFVRILDTKEPA